MNIRRVKLDIISTLMVTIAVFSVSTLSYTLWPVFLPMNKILGLFVFIEVSMTMVFYKKGRAILLILICLFLGIWDAFQCTDFSRNAYDFIYYTTTLFMLYIIKDNRLRHKMTEALRSRYQLIHSVIIVDTVLIVSSFLFSSSYTNAWGGEYFQGFTNSPHTLCPGICIMLTLLLFQKKVKKAGAQDYTVLAIGIYAIFESGARIFLIPAFIIIVFFFKYCIGSKSIKIFILPIFIIGVLYIFSRSEVLEKFDFVIGNSNISHNYEAQFTSGRTEFWRIDFYTFKQLSPIFQILGKGFDYVYYVNLVYYGMDIWAHNDLLDLLLSVGYLGTTIYLIVFYGLFRSLVRWSNKKLTVALLFLYSFVVMIINGFFGYQHYLYSFIILILSVENPNTTEYLVGDNPIGKKWAKT